MRLQVEIYIHVDHRREGVRSGAGCPPSESSGATVFIQLTVTIIIIMLLYCYNYCLCVGLRVITRHTFAIIVPFITGN